MNRPLANLSGLIIFSLMLLPALAAPDAERRTPVVRAVEKASPAVVNISTTKLVTVRDPFFDMMFGPQQRKTKSVGSGFLIHPAGYVVTNSHVVRAATEIVVSLDIDGSERQYPATVLAEEPVNDLALLKIEGGGSFPSVTLGRSDDLMIGEPVIAVGNPVGVGKTVTTGVLSGTGRSVRSPTGRSFQDFLQTDAAINPGNSGGPLLNIHGEIIGVNTAIIRGTEGLGFAIPVDRVKDIILGLIEAVVEHANLGFRPVAEDGGVSVHSVDPAGVSRRLRAGDLIKRVDGRAVTSVFDFATPFIGKKPGELVSLVIDREGAMLEVTITVPLDAEEDYIARRLGIIPGNQPDAARSNGARGVVVKRVLPDSPASRVKVLPGDVILTVEGYKIEDVRGLAALLKRARNGVTLNVDVARGGRTMSGSITVR